MIDFLIKNCDWIFSGIGVFIFGLILNKYFGVNKPIKNNSINTQSGRDSIITQYKVPDGIERLIVDMLKPAIADLGENLRKNVSEDLQQTLGGKIRETIEIEVLQKIKSEINQKNIEFHLNNVQIGIGDLDVDSARIKDTVCEISRISLFGEWIENVENISENERELSILWEEWLIALSKDDHTSKYKIYLDRMKQLTSSDVKLLLHLENNHIRRSRISGIDEYSIKKLTQLGLIKKNYMLVIFSAVGFISLGLGVHNIFNEHITIADTFRFSGLSIYFVLIIAFYAAVFFAFPLDFYLTKMGREIVSFSRKNEK